MVMASQLGFKMITTILALLIISGHQDFGVFASDVFTLCDSFRRGHLEIALMSPTVDHRFLLLDTSLRGLNISRANFRHGSGDGTSQPVVHLLGTVLDLHLPASDTLKRAGAALYLNTSSCPYQYYVGVVRGSYFMTISLRGGGGKMIRNHFSGRWPESRIYFSSITQRPASTVWDFQTGGVFGSAKMTEMFVDLLGGEVDFHPLNKIINWNVPNSVDGGFVDLDDNGGFIVYGFSNSRHDMYIYAYNRRKQKYQVSTIPFAQFFNCSSPPPPATTKGPRPGPDPTGHWPTEYPPGPHTSSADTPQGSFGTALFVGGLTVAGLLLLGVSTLFYLVQRSKKSKVGKVKSGDNSTQSPGMGKPIKSTLTIIKTGPLSFEAPSTSGCTTPTPRSNLGGNAGALLKGLPRKFPRSPGGGGGLKRKPKSNRGKGGGSKSKI